MAFLLRDFKEEVSRALANDAKERVRRFTPSRTLKDALRVERQGQRWYIGVPHYWAVYYHDGRGVSRSTRENGFLVWYKNPRDDPRHNGRYPVRASQVRTLLQAGITADRLRADVAAGRAVIARTSPRSPRRVAGKPFFRWGLQGYMRAAGNKIGRLAWTRTLRREMPRAFEYRRIPVTIRF